MDGPHLPKSRISPDAMPFDDVYRNHEAFVRRVIRRQGIPEHSVDDLAQDVFFTAYRKRDEIHSPAGIRHWLARISRYCASNWRRSRRRANDKHATFALMPQCVRSVEDSDRLVTRAQLQFYLSLLDSPKREVMVLTEAYGMTAREIAEHLHINDNTVRSRLHCARQILRGFAQTIDPQRSLIIESMVVDLLRDDIRSAHDRANSELAALLPLPLLFTDASSSTELSSLGSLSVGGFRSASKASVASVASGTGPAAGAEVGSTSLSTAAGSWWSVPRLLAWLGGTAAATGAAWLMLAQPEPEPRVEPAAEATVLVDQLTDPTPPPVPAVVASRLIDPFDRSTHEPAYRSKPHSREGKRVTNPSSLALEQALIDKALSAEKLDQLNIAHRALRRHHHRFRHGQLVAARTGGMIRVLCGLGRYADARDYAARAQAQAQTAASAHTALTGKACQAAAAAGILVDDG